MEKLRVLFADVERKTLLLIFFWKNTDFADIFP